MLKGQKYRENENELSTANLKYKDIEHERMKKAAEMFAASKGSI